MHYSRAALVGVLAGAIAVMFQWGLYWAEGARNHLLQLLRLHPTWGWLVLPATGACFGALAGYITSRYAPEASGSGIPHVKAVQAHLRALHWTRVLPIKFIGGLLGIGLAGFSMGREGPTVQMGASVGQGVAHLLRIPRHSEAHLVACGAGAGLAAAFNAPLAGFVFVIEEIRRELSSVTYGTALIAAICADIVARSLTGQLPSFHVYGHPAPPLKALPLAAVLGMLCGVLGVAFNRALLFSNRYARQWRRMPVWGKTALAGCLMGLVAWWLPEVLGGGHQTGENILRGQYTELSFLALLFIAKFCLTVICYATGAPGGIFAPLLVLGALVGLSVGDLASASFPLLAHDPTSFAVLGMAAFFTAVVRTPLTGIVLITEMTANYDQLLAVTVACIGAYLVAELMRDTPIYDALLRQDLKGRSQSATTAPEPIFVDLVVEPGCSLAGRAVSKVELPNGCSLVVIRRAGAQIVPTADLLFEPGDALTVVVGGNNLQAVATLQQMTRWTT